MASSEAESENDNQVVITISSADDAWEWFNRAVNEIDIPENHRIVFNGWPSFEIAIDGKDWDCSVPSRVMGPLMEVQKDLYRSYVQACFGETNLRKLRDEDREQLEIVVKVEKGSSKYEASLSKQLTKLANDALKDMESSHKMIMVLGIALTVGAVEINKAWVSQRQDEKQAEKTVELSKQETARLVVFSEGMTKVPELKVAKADYEASQNRLLKTLKPGDTVKSKGVELNSLEASTITHQEADRSKHMTISGAFRVLANNTTNGAGFRIKIARITDGLTFAADVPLELDHDQQKLIQKAEWSKGAIAVNLDISASVLRGKVSSAVVVSASESQ